MGLKPRPCASACDVVVIESNIPNQGVFTIETLKNAAFEGVAQC